jgi:zinc protease
MLKILFKGSSYEDATIGNEEDIRSFLKKEAEDFHYNYYSPANASLLISGDIEYSDAHGLIEKYFGGINKNRSLKRDFKKADIFTEDRRLKIYDNVKLPVLYFCFPIPEAGSRESYTLEYFANILANNRSSRFYRDLVYDKKLVKSVNATKLQLQHAGIFILSVVAYPDSDLAKIESEITHGINDFVRNGIKEEEFLKIKNKLEYAFTSKLSTLLNINSDLFNNWFFFNDANRINNNLERYLSVTKDDVVNSVKKYLFYVPKLVLTYLPKNN